MTLTLLSLCLFLPTTLSRHSITFPTSHTDSTVTTDTESPSYLPQPAYGQCGGSNREDGPSAIVSGEETEAGEFPYLALLGKTQRGKTRWFCAGTLINKYFVLTAAHCVQKSGINKVRLGEWRVLEHGDSLPREQDFDIGSKNVILHEDYKVQDTEVLNDIALIWLGRRAVLNEGVRLACLPFLGSEWPAGLRETGLGGRTATLVGWGSSDKFSNPDRDQTNTVASANQRKLKLPILAPGHCGRFNVTSSHLCAGGLIGSDACTGDGGAPLLYREDGSPWYLVGLLSYGTRVCGIGEPSVYTRITAFIPWIVENIK